MQIQDVIDKLTAPVDPISGTVDTLKCGDATETVRAVAVTFMASHAVIEEAISKGANLLITHEPTFYNHTDETDWLREDAVFQMKQRLIQDAGLAVFRFHDYLHRYQPDGILYGVLSELGWLPYANEPLRSPLRIPPMSVQQIVEHLKAKLGIPFVRTVGDLTKVCTRISVMPGAVGGVRQIRQLMQADCELLVVGEVNEWEANEYVRDAIACGIDKVLIVLGHQPSEEIGMKYLAGQLKTWLPEVPIHFISNAFPFQFV